MIGRNWAGFLKKAFSSFFFRAMRGEKDSFGRQPLRVKDPKPWGDIRYRPRHLVPAREAPEE